MSVTTAVHPLAAGDLDRPIKAVLPELARGASALGRLGVATPRDALFYLPFRYDDFSELRPLHDLVPDEKQSARVRVTDVKIEKGFGRRPQRVIAALADETGTAEAIWFGRRFVENRLRPGAELLVSGKVQLRGWRPQFVSPEFSAADHESLHTGRVVPVYRLSSGVTQKRVRELLARVLERALPGLDDPLTDRERGSLPGLADALHTAHFPEEAGDVPAALDRLAFDELLALQLTLAQAREARAALTAARIAIGADEQERLVATLPFRLTDDQRVAVDEVVADLAADRPMRRLLQGDVGSGKTAVAAVALAGTVRAGWQGALMAPTEILARQHHHGLAPLLEAMGIRAEFLSGSLTPARKGEIHDAIAAGEAEVVIGTHAVISEAVEFARLGLAVVDEQHRFGVAQRAALQAKGGELEPHVLALTATPIPRTLALTFYGDLSISTLRHLPPGPAADPHRAARSIGVAEGRGLHRRRGRRGTPELRGRAPRLRERGADGGQRRGRAHSPAGGPAKASDRAGARPAARRRSRRDDAGLRRRGAGRPGRHHRDRGGNRRAERQRDADRGCRALRPGAAAPAARPGGPRAASVLLHPGLGRRR